MYIYIEQETMQSIKFYKVNLDKFEEIMIFKHQQNLKQHEKDSSTKWTAQPRTAQPNGQLSSTKRTALPNGQLNQMDSSTKWTTQPKGQFYQMDS